MAESQKEFLRRYVGEFNTGGPVSEGLHASDTKPPVRPPKSRYRDDSRFNAFDDVYPLGTPGKFYNSMGESRDIEGMKTHYIKSTLRWMDSTFESSELRPGHKIGAKREELLKELKKRVIWMNPSRIQY